jgi:16S rRNA (adenine1518-N6/adenine1519-N6)-dimethyltransferase
MPRKQFGQHWLRSEKALRRILLAADLKPTDRVLEIGPGMGVLTKGLLAEVVQVTAVEIDRNLCERLREKFAGVANLNLVEADFLEMELASLGPLDKVVANIPYNITGPILIKLLGTISAPNPQPFQSLVLLVQKEVAERLTATPSSESKVFGALSVRVQYLAQVEVVCTVPAKAFYPPPKVDSAVIRLRPRHPAIVAQSPERLDEVVRLGFATRRKMLRNNLQEMVEREKLAEILTDIGADPQARAEELTLEQWVKLSNALDGKLGETSPITMG